MKQVRRTTIFIRKTKNKGFGLIELIIAITLMGLMAMIVLPNFGRGSRKKLEQQRQGLLGGLNQFLAQAAYNAIAHGKLQKVLFNVRQGEFKLEESLEKHNLQGELEFEPTVSLAPFHWDSKNFEIVNFYINDRDALAIDGGADKIWFYLTVDGLAQNVIINFIDIGLQNLVSEADFSLILNPFSAQFELHENFKRPA